MIQTIPEWNVIVLRGNTQVVRFTVYDFSLTGALDIVSKLHFDDVTGVDVRAAEVAPESVTAAWTFTEPTTR